MGGVRAGELATGGADHRTGLGQAGAALVAGWKSWCARARVLVRGTLANIRVQPAARSLRVRETVALGEKRLLALVEVGDERMLIGASSSSMVLLKQLAPELEVR